MPNTNETLGAYDPNLPLDRAATIPSAWYTDARIESLERERVFGANWLAIARVDQLAEAGRYVTVDVAGEPVVIVRGSDGVLRGFFNVCRHHATEVASEPEGQCDGFRCPYHGWSYELDGRLKSTPDFAGVCNFDKSANGLVPVRVDTWEQLIFVCLDQGGPSLREFLGDLVPRVAKLNVGPLRFVERRTYELACNWKVFVDNYLDGGYHVPYIHKALGSVLSYKDYTIENGDRFCVQSTPIEAGGGEAETAAVRGGDMAHYFWLYPNFMLNWYEGYMDTNHVWPLGPDRTRVVFDFYFADAADGNGANTQAYRRQSLKIAERVQQEDIDVCQSVQRGLQSRAYDTGRLSVRREAGEHLFHRLLHADLTTVLDTTPA